MITIKQGKFLFGDFYSTKAVKLNIKQNGFSGPFYVYINDWKCLESLKSTTNSRINK